MKVPSIVDAEYMLTEAEFIQNYLACIEYNDYDRLIQLCDALSFPTGPTYIEKRLVDVALRYGFNELTIPKWEAFLKSNNILIIRLRAIFINYYNYR